MVQGFGVQFEDHYLIPVTHREILTRMIQNLVNIYQKLDEEAKVSSLKEYSQIVMSQNKRDR